MMDSCEDMVEDTHVLLPVQNECLSRANLLPPYLCCCLCLLVFACVCCFCLLMFFSNNHAITEPNNPTIPQ